jgi:hypothetical protein
MTQANYFRKSIFLDSEIFSKEVFMRLDFSKIVRLVILLLTFLVSSSYVVKAQRSFVDLFPDQNGIVLINSRRFLDEFMPQILANDQKKLSEINADLDRIKAKTEIDIRQFDEIAIGLKAVSDKRTKSGKLEILVLVRGNYNPESLITAAKVLNRTYREERLGNTTLVVFSTKDFQVKQKSIGSAALEALKLLGTFIGLVDLPEEIAICAVDNKTLAFGSLSSVKELLTSTTKLSPEIIKMVNERPNAIVRFGVSIPEGFLRNFVSNIGDSEVEKIISSIKQLSGWGDLTEKGIQISLSAKTDKAEDAEVLAELLQTLRMLAGGFLNNVSDKNKKIYAKIINDVIVSRNESLVSLLIGISKEDFHTLIAKN